MAAFNFPNSPSTNDLHTENGVTYKWNGTVWKRQNASYTDATNLNVTGISTFAGAIDSNSTLEVAGIANFDSTVKIADKIEHLGDSNTNIRFPANDTITAETSGSEKLRIDSSGRIGIGTVTPSKALHVYKSNEHPLLLERGDSANTQVELRTGGVVRGYWGCSTTSNFMVYDNDTSDINFTVLQTGKVGIGTNSPSFFTHIQGDGVSTDVLKITARGSGQMVNIQNYSNVPSIVRFSNYLGNAFWDAQYNTDNSFSLDFQDGEKFRITSDGKIGIGPNTSPAKDLHIYNTGVATLRIETGDSRGQAWDFLSTYGGSANTGTLSVRDEAGNSWINFSKNGGSPYTTLRNGTAEHLRIDANGDMYARADATVYLVMGSAGDATSGGPTNNMNWLRGDSNDLLYNAIADHKWEVGGTEKMLLEADGDLKLQAKTQVRITLGNVGTHGSNNSNWIRGDDNNIMLNCANSSGDHIFEVAGSAKAKINGTVGVRAENTCKAWLAYRSEAGSEQIIDDFFVASVSDEATGTFYVNLDGDIGTEDGIAYIFGSHNDGARPLQAVIGYTPSHGSYNPWWSMEDGETRVNVMRADNNTKVDGEWFSMAAFGDAF